MHTVVPHTINSMASHAHIPHRAHTHAIAHMRPPLHPTHAHLEVLVLRHDGDLVAVHAEDLALEVDELPLTHLHVVPRLEVVFPLLPCRTDVAD